jgi:ribose-phosphate pyrophosphokinase
MRREIRDMIFLKTPKSEEFAGNVYNLFLNKLKTIDYHGEVPQLGHIYSGLHNDGEIKIDVETNIRDYDAYIFLLFGQNEHGNFEPNVPWVELYLIDDALRRACVDRITYVIPFFSYTRQDRKDKKRSPSSVKRLLDNLILNYDPQKTRILTLDIHAKQIPSFVNFPIWDIKTLPMFVDYYRQRGGEYAIVAADAGAVERAEIFRDRLNHKFPLVLVGKTRPEAGEIGGKYIAGKEAFKDFKSAVIVEDLIDTGGTIADDAREILDGGAEEIAACAPHWVGSPKRDKKDRNKILFYPEDKMREFRIRVSTTNSILRNSEYWEKRKDFIEAVMPVEPLIADAIYRAQTRGVSDLEFLR